ncbi:PH domain-containing protein [uncultured Tessaracoccus sp.]|uniref:PH domain-containing protein n=1 Tax=uncultured Tessaracoccus sp. TaxID=905023 RepID=UPI0026398C04|nr:PH domain-containing protein [uncultured Tessaracoccus sp.]
MPSMDTLFAPPAEQWQPISRKYLTVKLISIAIIWTILGGAMLVGAYFAASAARMPWIFWVALVGVLALVTWRFVRAPRVWKRWGYAERDEDVYVTQGLWHRELTCVPYGRMQLVEVSAGPIERMFGLASVQMVTASSSGSITIPGLDREAAEAIRDRFINRGQHLRAGI